MSKELSKFAADIIGIPDRSDYGSPTQLIPDSLVPWVVQQHEAERAGSHKDVRLGKDKMLSFATRKELPTPGNRIALFPQPLHDESYADFQGEIPDGYGKGTVSTADRGEAYISEATPRKIKFVTAHKKNAEEFTLIKLKGKDGKDFWLMSNTTPTEPANYPKVKYKKLPAEDIDKLMDPEYVMSAKIDGAAAFLKLMKDHVSVLSYRPNVAGNAITHTERMHVAGKMNIPKELQGTVLRGEIWGEQGGKAIPAASLGGLLNSTIANSVRAQAADDIKMRMALFGVKETQGKPWEGNFQDSRALIQKAIHSLPADIFHEPLYAETVKQKKKLWNDIKTGKLPMTREGVVGFPLSGDRPIKAKLEDDHDVHIREIFPGEGKYKDKAAGGFYYSMTPDGPIVGKVGTGLSDEERKRMLKNPEEYVGRVARVTAQEVFPSGALRAPAFIALHEDAGPGIKYAASELPTPSEHTENQDVDSGANVEASTNVLELPKPVVEENTNQKEVLNQLLKAKKFSDQGRFDLKNAILRKLMLAYPDQWVVDQPDRFRPGVRHNPTKFMLHIDRDFLPTSISK